MQITSSCQVILASIALSPDPVATAGAHLRLEPSLDDLVFGGRLDSLMRMPETEDPLILPRMALASAALKSAAGRRMEALKTASAAYDSLINVEGSDRLKR